MTNFHTDLSENFEKRIEENIKLISPKIALSKYVIYRSFYVFLVILNYNFILNFTYHLNYFFEVSPRNIAVLSFFHICLFIFLIILSLSFITLCHLSFKIGLKNALKKIKFKNIPKPTLSLLETLIKNEFEIEKGNKFTIPTVIFSFILIVIINGSPFINNFKGVYFKYSSGDYTVAEKTYVFLNNTSEKKINSIIKVKGEIIMEEGFIDEHGEYFDDDLDYYWTTSGYLFKQTANIEGFNTYREYKPGFISYISSLIYFLIEKAIMTLIYFIIPMLITISISFYRKN